MDTTDLSTAFRNLLAAADDPARAAAPPPGEWDADQVLAHVTLVNAITISAVCSVASGTLTTYDNRIASDTWTIGRVVELVGRDGLLRRIERQGEALVALASDLSTGELATLVPTILVSNGALMVDDQLPLSGLVDGLAQSELPGHAEQLRALAQRRS